MCFYEALSQADGHVGLHPENCIGCELCYDVCPFKAISMHPTTPEQMAKGYFDIPEDVYEHDKFKTRRTNPESIGKSLLKETA
jgi:dihydroorotate dehydrogenase (fumarate)/dihydropyrimidine dehydrogenase (NAD+) subunit PreA